MFKLCHIHTVKYSCSWRISYSGGNVYNVKLGEEKGCKNLYIQYGPNYVTYMHRK